MRSCLMLLMAALLVFSSMPASATDYVGAHKVTLLSNGEDVTSPVPERDPLGQDWITYDDGNPSGLITGAAYWSKVRFTPVSSFSLRGIHVLPLNQGPNEDESMTVRVYRMDQDTDDLTDMVYETVIEQVNPFGQDAEHVIEFEEDEYVEFEANEDFAILYNAPGGPYNAGQNGAGWWNLYDGANNGRRSFYAATDEFGDDPDMEHDNWTMLPGDLILRANGEYLEEYFDLGIVELYNESDNWLLFQEQEQVFAADIINNGGDVEAYVVSFQVLDMEGEVIWDNQVVAEPIGEGDEATVTADEPWVTPAELGNYTVWAYVEAEDDANEDNNQAGLDQIVFDPAGEEEQWLGFTDMSIEGTTAWNEDSGWAVAFHHPGGDYQELLQLDAFRVMVYHEEPEIELEFAVHILDLEAGQVTPIWMGTAWTTGEGEDLGDGVLEWVEVEPDWEEEPVPLAPGVAYMITYFYSSLTRFPEDGDLPFSGTNTVMPPTHLNTQDDGQQYGFANAGDWYIQARISESDALLPGAHLSIVPSPVDFGYNLELNTDYEMEAHFISTGQDPVNVNSIQIAPSGRDYLTIEPADAFEIPSGDTATVTVTFNAAEDVDLEVNVLVRSNDENQANMIWPIMASTNAPEGPHIEVNETDVEFGYNLAMNEDHNATVVVHSTGSEDLVVDAIAIPDDYADYLTVDPADEFTVAPGETQEVVFTFNTDMDMEMMAEITLTDNAADEDVMLHLHASTAGMPPMMRVEPTELMFGYELETGMDYPMEAWIWSDGEEDLVIEGFEIPEMYQPVFTVTHEGELPMTIAPGDSAMVTITFNTAEDMVINTEIGVMNNSVNHPDFMWTVQASTHPESVNDTPQVPDYYALYQNYPNPFNPTTTIEFAIGKAGQVSLDVFDLSGRRIMEVVNGELPAGLHTAEISLQNLPAGTYLYQLESGEFSSIKKMVLMK